MAQQKIDKEFCLTDNTVNVYGYRLLTEGCELHRFNPALGFLMHNRDKGVAVRWEDFRIEGDKLFAKPVVNVSMFPDLADQIVEGFYNAASVGKIVALELTDDAALKLPGQTGPTVVKWFPRECSIVDIPGNYNALGQLYDENDHLLHDLVANANLYQHTNHMTKIEVTASILSLLNLKDDATGDQFSVMLADLVAKAQKADALELELSALRKSQKDAKIKDIITKGLADRKMTNEMATALSKDYAENPDGLQALVDAMKPQQLVTAGINNQTTGLPSKFAGKSFNDLYVSGELAELKANFPDYYEILKKS